MADWSDISDLWWLQPQRESGRALQGLALGAQMRQARTQEDFRRDQAQVLIDQRRAAMQTQEAKVRGIAAMSSYMADVAARNAWTDPNAKAGFYRLGAQYPQAIDDPTLQAMARNFEMAESREAQAKQHAQTTTITELARARLLLREAADIEKLGPPTPEQAAEINEKRTEAQTLFEKQTPVGETTEIYDPATGNLLFRVDRGRKGAAAKDITAPTQAVLTETQKQSLAGESGITTGIKLINSLTEKDVGARGFFNEYVVNRGLSQIFPEFQENEVASGRTLIRIFNEQQKKAIKSDQQLNKEEQARLEAALPSPGPLESVANAKAKIATFVEKSREVSRINAERLKLPILDWMWTQDEVAAKLKSGEITVDKAKEILKRWHYKL